MNDFHARHQGLFQPENLNNKRVFLTGCGSVGSELARMLARAGVQHFLIVDPDVVAESNLCRTAYLARDLGTSKVDALARCLTGIREEIDIETHAIPLGSIDDDRLGDWIGASDLVIAATDHPPTQARLGALSYPVRPAIFPGVYAKGTGGEVLWTLPEATPCYACVLGAIRGANAPRRGRTDYGLATGQLAAEPALGIDILHVTVCAAKIALALLLRESGSTVEEILDPARSVLFVGNAVDWIWKEPFETVWARATRRDDCLCRLAPGGSTADLELLTGEEGLI
jgi:molybdopterin/thiamine biosynthesis adenylyltransferase